MSWVSRSGLDWMGNELMASADLYGIVSKLQHRQKGSAPVTGNTCPEAGCVDAIPGKIWESDVRVVCGWGVCKCLSRNVGGWGMCRCLR